MSFNIVTILCQMSISSKMTLQKPIKIKVMHCLFLPCFYSSFTLFYPSLTGSKADEGAPLPSLVKCSERNTQLDYQSEEDQGYLSHIEHV
jgi:hypothetical protein